jgi:hypothetical protein
LDDHPLYESLSYVWGESKKDETILLDDKSLEVTQSLRTALSYLRLSDEERILWIDQICIDQENPDERSHQVLQMSKIYKEATRNIAWLGEPDDDTAVAFDLVKRLVNTSTFSVIKRPIEPWSVSHIKDMYDMVSTSPPSTIELHELGVTQITPRESQALIASFGKRRIWSRIWIIQEFVFAWHMMVQCGYHTLDWQNIDYIMDSHICRPGFLDRYHLSVTIALVSAFKNSLLILSLRISLLRKRLVPWTEILTLTRRWEATDDKDRVYALLGLSEDIGIVPDYRRSVHDTFVATVIAILNHNKNLDILCRNRPYTTSDTLHQNATELPSWVPRFGTEAAEVYTKNNFYDASRGCPKFDFECPEGLGMLSVHGKHVDYVYITFGQRVAPEGHKPPVWQNALQYKAPWLILLLLQRSLSQSQSSDALWRTVVMDQGYNDGVPGPLRENEVSAYRKEYQQWFSSLMASTNDHLPPADTNFTRSALYMLKDRFITVTRQGRFASVPWDVKIGDEICILHGAKMPVIVRRDENTRFSKLIGVAYVHGLMRGEAFESATLLPSREYTIG